MGQWYTGSRTKALGYADPASRAQLELAACGDIDERQEYAPPANVIPSATATAVVNGVFDRARLVRAPCPYSIRLTAAKYVATSRSPAAQGGLVTAANTQRLRPPPVSRVPSVPNQKPGPSELPHRQAQGPPHHHEPDKRSCALRCDLSCGSETYLEESKCRTMGRRPSSDRDRHHDRDRRDQHRRRRQQAESGRLSTFGHPRPSTLTVDRLPVAPRQRGKDCHRDRTDDAEHRQMPDKCGACDQHAARGHGQG